MNERNESTKPAKKIIGIEIWEDVEKGQFISLYIATLFIGFLMVLPAIFQPEFLKEVIKVEDKEFYNYNFLLRLMSQYATLIFAWLAGYLSDRIGRRVLAIFGFASTGIFVIAMWNSNTLGPVMGISPENATLIFRFLWGAGMLFSWAQFITMASDYSLPSSRGKAMAINGSMTGAAALIVFGGVGAMSKALGLVSQVYFAAGAAIIGFLICSIVLKDRMPTEKKEKPKVTELVITVFKSVRLSTSFVITFFCRVNIVIIGVLVIPWLVKVAPEFGKTSSQGTFYGAMCMLAMTIISIFAFPVIGGLMDRFGALLIVTISCFVTVAGYMLLGSLDQPFTWLLGLFVILVGIGNAGVIAGSNAITSQAAPKRLVGSMLSWLNVAQAVGAIIFLECFRRISYTTPLQDIFSYKGWIDLCLGIFLILIFKKFMSEQRKVEAAAAEGNA